MIVVVERFYDQVTNCSPSLRPRLRPGAKLLRMTWSRMPEQGSQGKELNHSKINTADDASLETHVLDVHNTYLPQIISRRRRRLALHDGTRSISGRQRTTHLECPRDADSKFLDLLCLALSSIHSPAWLLLERICSEQSISCKIWCSIPLAMTP